ncbi:hypothetical protein AZL_d02090 (plasmid) [Azospirillum sp. B510]|nr:hypothetical protein AZL_d02090 [Azospirillum sp. B510]
MRNPQATVDARSRSGSPLFLHDGMPVRPAAGGSRAGGSRLRQRLGNRQGAGLAGDLGGDLGGKRAMGRLGGAGDDIEIEHDNLSWRVVRPPGSPVFGF